MTIKAKTHFEQVPVEVVKKIADIETGHEERAEQIREDEKKSHKGEAMTAQFDVFLKEPRGQVMWQGCARTLEKARAIITKLDEKSPHSEYIIFNPRTGHRMIVKSPDSVGTGKPAEREPMPHETQGSER